LDIRRIGKLKDTNEIVGGRTRVKVVKNKMASPFREAEFGVDTLEAYNVPDDILAISRKNVGEHLLPVQERAVKEFGLFVDANLIVFSPTSSGKTFIGSRLPYASKHPYATTAGGSGKPRATPTPHRSEAPVSLEPPLPPTGGGSGKPRTTPTPHRSEAPVSLEPPRPPPVRGSRKPRASPTPQLPKLPQASTPPPPPPPTPPPPL